LTDYIEPGNAERTTMTKALDQLAELVRQAEAKTRARKIEAETQHAAEQFRVAEERARRAVERHRVARPANMRILEQANSDEQLLKDLVRKLALYKSSLNSQADAEKLIAASQSEIERTRAESRAEIEEISREIDEARRELRAAIDAYRQLRRELDRLQPELGMKFSAEDRLLWDAEAHFPGGQLQLLANEVDAGLNGYASLGKLEQYARLKVWIGRFRFYQATQDHESELSEEHDGISHRVFHQLKWLSRQYEPGYIEAFRQDFSTDWSAYVTEAQEQLHQAIEACRRARGADREPPRDHEFEVERIPPPSQGVFPRVVALMHSPASPPPNGPAQPHGGQEGLSALSRNLDRIQPQKADAQSCDAS
jgi:DNA repair exonuclease SbcCD ATPase subunit